MIGFDEQLLVSQLTNVTQVDPGEFTLFLSQLAAVTQAYPGEFTLFLRQLATANQVDPGEFTLFSGVGCGSLALGVLLFLSEAGRVLLLVQRDGGYLELILVRLKQTHMDQLEFISS